MLMYDPLMGVLCFSNPMVAYKVNYLNIEDYMEIIWAYNLMTHLHYLKNGNLLLYVFGILVMVVGLKLCELIMTRGGGIA